MRRVAAAVAIWTILGSAASLAWLGRDQPTWEDALRSPLAPLLGAAVAAGALPAAALAGSAWARRVLKASAGGALGALAGLGTYTAGYVIAARQGGAGMEEVALLAEEALRSSTVLQHGAVVLGAAVGITLTRYSWRLYGTVSYVALLAIVAGYLIHVVTVSLPSVPRSALALSLVLFAAEAFSLLMVAVHAFYALDVAARKKWRRHPGRVTFSRHFVPKVAVHVATYNEPPAMVIETLESLRRLDYPRDRLVVMVLDDSTDDALAAPVQRWCADHSVLYHRRADRRGFKAGALNEGLRLTPEDVDLIAVLDADFQVEPGFLRETVGHFVDPKLGFLQTPQDYRNADHSFLTRQYRYADAYFYRAVLPSRNEENAIIFCGTMGILRRQAIVDAGGWGEDYLCEDAELSVRVLRAGYSSLYVNKTFGRGLIPPTYEAYRKQHHRWAYGGAQVLRGHLRSFLLGPLSGRQKLDFLVGGIHWFEGVAVVVMAAALLALGVGDLLGRPVLTHHQWDVWLLALVPFLLTVDGVARIHLAMRRAIRLPVAGTFAVIGMWMSVKLDTTWAAVKGLLGVRLAFARTSKVPDARLPHLRAVARAARVTPFETSVALALAAVGGALAWSAFGLWQAGGGVVLTRVLLAGWLAFYALLFACAPIYAYKSWTTLPPALAAAPEPTPEPEAWADAP